MNAKRIIANNPDWNHTYKIIELRRESSTWHSEIAQSDNHYVAENFKCVGLG